jgi:hypothetical protein
MRETGERRMDEVRDRSSSIRAGRSIGPAEHTRHRQASKAKTGLPEELAAGLEEIVIEEWVHGVSSS